MGKGERKLLDQIEFLFMVWAQCGHDSEQTAMALNGLFEIAKQRDPAGMNAAFARGINAVLRTRMDT